MGGHFVLQWKKFSQTTGVINEGFMSRSVHMHQVHQAQGCWCCAIHIMLCITSNGGLLATRTLRIVANCTGRWVLLLSSNSYMNRSDRSFDLLVPSRWSTARFCPIEGTTHSFIRSFVRSFVRSFIHSFILICPIHCENFHCCRTLVYFTM